MLKMLSVGAIEWPGFIPPSKPYTTDSPRNKKPKQVDNSISTKQAITQSQQIVTPPQPQQIVTSPLQTNPKPQQQPYTPVVVTTKSVGTSMQERYDRHNPSPACKTRLDVLMQKCLDAVERINTARVERKQRSQDEIVMLIQFITRFVLKNNCSLTIAIDEAQFTFHWKRKDIFDIIHRYLESTDVKPKVQEHKKRGRGAELFKLQWGDHFCVLKKRHASEILEYVRLANKQRGGMVTCGRIQAHLLQKYNKHFKRATIYYCLTRRLGLKYANSGKQRIVFTAARTRSAMVYCKKYDEAIKYRHRASSFDSRPSQ